MAITKETWCLTGEWANVKWPSLASQYLFCHTFRKLTKKKRWKKLKIKFWLNINSWQQSIPSDKIFEGKWSNIEITLHFASEGSQLSRSRVTCHLAVHVSYTLLYFEYWSVNKIHYQKIWNWNHLLYVVHRWTPMQRYWKIRVFLRLPQLNLNVDNKTFHSGLWKGQGGAGSWE